MTISKIVKKISNIKYYLLDMKYLFLQVYLEYLAYYLLQTASFLDKIKFENKSKKLLMFVIDKCNSKKMPILNENHRSHLFNCIIYFYAKYNKNSIIREKIIDFIEIGLYSPTLSLELLINIVENDSVNNSHLLPRIGKMKTIRLNAINYEKIESNYKRDIESISDVQKYFVNINFAKFFEYENLEKAIQYYERAVSYSPQSDDLIFEIEFISFIKSKAQNLIDLEEKNNFSHISTILIGIVVWGHDYIDCLSGYLLDNLLKSVKDKSKLPDSYKVKVMFACRENDKYQIMENHEFMKLFDVDFIEIPDKFFNDDNLAFEGKKYEISTWMHSMFTFICGQKNMHYCHLSPDVIITDDLMDIFSKAIDAQDDAILVTGLRLNKYKAKLAYDQIIRGKKYNLENILNFGQHATKILHQGSLGLIRNSDKMKVLPGILLYETIYGYCGRFIHLVPLFISNRLTKNFKLRRFDSIDGEYTQALLNSSCHPDHFSLRYLNSKDRIIMWEMTDEKIKFPEVFGPRTHLMRCLYWLAYILARNINRKFFEITFDFQFDDRRQIFKSLDEFQSQKMRKDFEFIDKHMAISLKSIEYLDRFIHPFK